MDETNVRFQFGPPIRAIFLGGLRHAQAGFLAVAFGSAILFIRYVPGQAGAIIAMLTLIAGVAGAFGTIEGRPFDDWVPASSRWAMLVLVRKRRWRSPAPGKGERGSIAGAANTNGSVVRRAGKQSPPPPVSDWQLIYTSVSGQAMGVLRDKKAKTWVAVISVQGQSFMLLDESEQVRRLSSWAAVQASMARQGSPISRMQWLERTLPEVGDEMRSFFDDRANAATGSAAHSSYAELLKSAQPVTQQHETYLVLQVSAAKAGRAIKHAGGGDRGAVAVLYRELEHLQRQLRESDLTVSGFLSGDQLALLLRTQFDPEDALALVARQARSDEALISARSAWPLATEVSWGYYRTDKMYHITYWISEWPKLGVRPSFLAPLLLTSNGVTRTISVVAEPIPTAQAVRKVEHQQTARLSDDEIRAGAGYRTGARRRREAEALDRRENELADGHAENRYSGYVTVSGSDLNEVEIAAATVEQVAYQCPVELRRLWGEQDSAFYCTVPMARGLT
ncbi:MAG: PrgI family protein [Actinomycetia bacterium]|nr:PrgI family protein [Actinomycetes bacterium]